MSSCWFIHKINLTGFTIAFIEGEAARKSTSEGVLTVRRSEAIERQRSIWFF